MGVSSEFIWTVVISIIGFLLSFQFYQITESIKEIWKRIDRLNERTNECDGKHDIAEERAKHALERLETLEQRRRQ